MRVPWLCREVRLTSPLPPEALEGVLRAHVLPYVDEPPANPEKPYMGSVSSARFLLYPLGRVMPDWRPQARGRVRSDGAGSTLEVEVGLRPAMGATVHLLFASLVVLTLVTAIAMAARGEFWLSAAVPLVAGFAFFATVRWRFCQDADCIERFLRDTTAPTAQLG